MHKMKQALRTTFLYISAVVIMGGGIPAITFADSPTFTPCVDKNAKRWAIDPSNGKCVRIETLTPSAPADTTTDGAAPATDSTQTPSTDGTTGSDSANTVQSSGDGSNTSTDTNTNASSDTTDKTKTDVKNDQTSTSNSGNANVSGNKSDGSAKTGDASGDTTIVNSVHSTSNGDKGVAHFTADIDGDVTGDITLGPTINGSLSSTNNVNASSNTNASNDTSLTNNINASSKSGDATVSGNGSSGNATSGNANTVANVLNLINTIIAANQSFIGTINIRGNLNGDLLISPEFIPQLIASNASNSTNLNLALATTTNDDQSIVNNVKLNATSGDATVTGNNSAGSATTGTGTTNLTILNLTGHQVNAANSLLVFVNVLGTWVGMIVDAPGATAAALGNGVTSNTINAVGNANLSNTAAITNNLDLSANSGDATVSGNGSQGSAASGNATASANIANISTSTFDLSSWFGVLYINVFGSWIGSFGVDTAAGTITPINTAVGAPAGTIASPNMSFGFRPKSIAPPSSDLLSKSLSTTSNAANDAAVAAAAVLASAKVQPASQLGSLTTPVATKGSDPFSMIAMVGGFGIAGLYGAWIGIRRYLDSRI